MIGRHKPTVSMAMSSITITLKPMPLFNLVYRDQLFPRRAYPRAFEALFTECHQNTCCLLLCKSKYLQVLIDTNRRLVHRPNCSDAKDGNGTTAMVKLIIGRPPKCDPMVSQVVRGSR